MNGQYGAIETAQVGGSADLNGDGIVNFEDFAIFANQWLQTTN